LIHDFSSFSPSFLILASSCYLYFPCSSSKIWGLYVSDIFFSSLISSFIESSSESIHDGYSWLICALWLPSLSSNSTCFSQH
jgi:hypothetical protein